MPIMIQRKLKCKFTGSDDYLPEGIPRDKFIPVIGFEYRKREQHKDGKSFWVEDLYYVVINNKGKAVSIASFNCSTMIDESAEIPAGQLIQLLNNITIMGKVISENMAKNDKTGNRSSSDQTG